MTLAQKPREDGAAGPPVVSTRTRIRTAARSYAWRTNGCVFKTRQSPEALEDIASARMLSRRADESFIHKPRAKRCRSRSSCPIVSYRPAIRPSARVNRATRNRSGRVTLSPTTASQSGTASSPPGGTIRPPSTRTRSAKTANASAPSAVDLRQDRRVVRKILQRLIVKSSQPVTEQRCLSTAENLDHEIAWRDGAQEYRLAPHRGSQRYGNELVRSGSSTRRSGGAVARGLLAPSFCDPNGRGGGGQTR